LRKTEKPKKRGQQSEIFPVGRKETNSFFSLISPFSREEKEEKKKKEA